MRIGLIGDIHGNAVALEEVLSAARREKIDVLCVTGDFVGYYYEPKRVFEILGDWQYWAIRGNHDDMLLAAADNPDLREGIRKKYGAGLDRAIETLNRDCLAAIAALPSTRTVHLGGRSLLLGHGTPWDTNVYLYPDAPQETWERAAESKPDVVLLGHTHHQFSRHVGETLVVNPGSVGQPRDRKPGAAWSILDTETMELEHRREFYDISIVVAQAQLYNPELPYLQTVLSRT
ncbi:MAG: metallophosphoesterase family protein [Rhodobacteraceae bacterium]|nr:metallophosphoesterase family protein [Paracoccaceae bacterium]